MATRWTHLTITVSNIERSIRLRHGSFTRAAREFATARPTDFRLRFEPEAGEVERVVWEWAEFRVVAASGDGTRIAGCD